jgi:septal ring factor EnvC (AmiA/AmiB activator)
MSTGVLRFLVVTALIAALAGEGYYIYHLRGKIEDQEEELQKISIQLQSLRSERENLHEELSSMKKSMEAEKDGNTVQRGP